MNNNSFVIMTFDEYCISKLIDATKFKAGNYDLWKKLSDIFEEMHPKSFTQQKLFLLNDIRRTYQLPYVKPEKPVKEAVVKPTIKVAPKVEPVVEIKPTTETQIGEDAPKKPGFKPVFKKKAESETTELNTEATPQIEDVKQEESPKKVPFKPVFKKKVESETSDVKTEETPQIEEVKQEEAPKKVPFKPVMKKRVETETLETKVEETPQIEEVKQEEAPKKVPFKPIMKKRDS